jgi:Na+-transporting NADH:ubiquinone oxidoreductase subunit NqrC
MDSGDITIPPELQICEPLLEFYLQGVLIPVLENLTAYAGPKTGLRKSAEKAKETDLQGNVSQVCKFMKALMNPNAKMHQVFQVTKKSIRPRLLKFIQQQASVEDDTTTQLTIDVFASQYDIEKHSVFLKTDDLLGLSNLLIEHENKLRLTENDEVHL